MSDGMITQTYSLDLVPGGNQLVVNVSQYDKLGRLLVFNLYQAGLAYSIPSGTGATIKGTKPDGKGFDYAMTVGNGKVSISVPQQMTAVAGDTVCEVMLTDSAGNTIATANFILSVEHAAMDDATVVSDNDIPVFEGLVAQATTQAANASASASEAAASATASANSASASASSATKAETALRNMIYPVNSIYLSLGSTSPAQLFGGSWAELLPDGNERNLLVVPASTGSNKTGGSKTTGSTTLTIAQIPSHRHQSNSSGYSGNVSGGAGFTIGIENNYSELNSFYTTYVGGNQGHTHPLDWLPYITIHAWKRIG